MSWLDLSINMQHELQKMNQVPKHGVFADRMNSGLDWIGF